MKRFSLKPPPQPKLVESDVAKACKQLLAYRGYYPVRLQSGLLKSLDGQRVVRVGEVGIPDFAFMHKRYPGFFLETKRPQGELSDTQKKKHWEMTVAYGLAIATIDRVEALIPWLDAHEARARDP